MGRKRILLIEDEKDLIETVSLRLEAAGYEVISASDGLEGLGKARKEKPDLIILDLMLPKMDGYKVCGLLKADTRYNGIPVIMLTARAQELDRKMGEEVCVDAYITKPFEPQGLLKEIQQLLNKKK